MLIGWKGQGPIVLLMMLCLGASARSQEPAAPKPAAVAPEAVPATDPATEPPAAGQSGQSDTPPRPAGPKPGYVKTKGKLVYTGPSTVVELPPTPILDEEGKQRLSPDGTPMFNPPVKQQRDRHGNPLFDDKGKPVMQTAKDLGYDDHGKKLIAKHERPPKTIAVLVTHGTLTVDGMIGKAQLNYDIKDFKYIYLYAPWVGTVVVSNLTFPGATPQPAAFNDKTLTVTVGEHTFQLASDKPLLGVKPTTAFVLVDRNFQLPSKMPVMGYGATVMQPYAWPGAKLVAGSKIAPPIPVNLRPTALLPPCPAGQMRKPGPPVLPGEVRDEPCVPIGTASAPVSSAKPAAAPPPPR